MHKWLVDDTAAFNATMNGTGTVLHTAASNTVLRGSPSQGPRGRGRWKYRHGRHPHAHSRPGRRLAGDVTVTVSDGEFSASTTCPILPACTITGTAGSNTLFGTPGDDILCGLDGDDVLLGNGGNDVLLGGPGRDSLFGHTGNDQLRGDDDIDLLIGNTGNDVHFGGAGGDRLFAPDGVASNDTIRGGTGRDLCTTDPGDTATSCP